jgi:hypothetical protein
MHPDGLALILTIYITILGPPSETHVPVVVLEQTVPPGDCHRLAKEYIEAHVMLGRTLTYSCR